MVARKYMKFISSVEQDISRVSEANEYCISCTVFTVFHACSVFEKHSQKKSEFYCKQSR